MRTSEGKKPVKAKPSLYAHIYYGLKEIAKAHGYNLVLHGSLDRDLDLVCIPWAKKVKPVLPLMKKFAEAVDGSLMKHSTDKDDPYRGTLPQGRTSYVINMRRSEVNNDEYIDYQYYIDISVTPSVTTK